MSDAWDHWPTAYLPEGSRWKETCRECDEFWPCFAFQESMSLLTPEILEDIMSESKSTSARFLKLIQAEIKRLGEEPPDLGVLAKL